ncbi:MAG: MBL fold metallo-hydrolase [Bacilli bacterium]|nr:MBL fold metallo-hydrolase [Bacilli bacterium]
MIKFCSLSSGSKGNTSFLEINGNKYLIDIGNTSSFVEKQLNEIGVNPKEINGIFITHYHHDHIDGLKVFIKRYNPIVYLSEETYQELTKTIKIDNFVLFSNTEFIDFNLTLIPTSHDAKGSYGFVFDDCFNNNIVYVTDTGYVSEKNLKLMQNKKLYYFESNHDIELLMNGSYPYHLKQRILGDKGHLSNKTASYYLHEIIGDNTKTIILAHLSQENNDPDVALNEILTTFNNYNQNVERILLGKQNERGELIELC